MQCGVTPWSPHAVAATPLSLTLREAVAFPHLQLNPACLQPQGTGPPWAHWVLPPAQVISLLLFLSLLVDTHFAGLDLGGQRSLGNPSYLEMSSPG